MLRPRVLTRVFLAASLVLVGVLPGQAAAARAENSSAVRFCAAKNLVKSVVVLPSDVMGLVGGGWYRLSLVFTNRGATACALAGVPSAQPVVGLKHTPVGPESLSGPMPRWTGAPIRLAARKGTANVLYSMRIPTPDFPVSHGCIAKASDGVDITLRNETDVLLTAYFRTAKKQVCANFQTTSVEGEQLRPLGSSRVNGPLGCTTVWISNSSLMPEYRGQTVDDALQASAVGFSKFGPVVFEKMTGPGFMLDNRSGENPWYLVFTKDGHKGLGLVEVYSLPDGFTYASIGPYCSWTFGIGFRERPNR